MQETQRKGKEKRDIQGEKLRYILQLFLYGGSSQFFSILLLPFSIYDYYLCQGIYI
jgi:hypothetical protein